MLNSFLSFWQRARVRAVFPDPTGLPNLERDEKFLNKISSHAPANSDSESSLLKISIGIIRHVTFRIFAYSKPNHKFNSRSFLLEEDVPAWSRCSWVWPWSPPWVWPCSPPWVCPPPPCEWPCPSCEWLCVTPGSCVCAWCGSPEEERLLMKGTFILIWRFHVMQMNGNSKGELALSIAWDHMHMKYKAALPISLFGVRVPNPYNLASFVDPNPQVGLVYYL